MGTGWQFCDHHPSHKSFKTNVATFAIFVIIIAKPFRLQHRDFQLRHSMASRGIIITGSSCVVIQNHFTIQEISGFFRQVECKHRYRINDISPQCGESAQEERKSSPQRSQVEKWIEVDFEPVVAQSYRRTWYPNSCNPPNPQSSVTWSSTELKSDGRYSFSSRLPSFFTKLYCMTNCSSSNNSNVSSSMHSLVAMFIVVFVAIFRPTVVLIDHGNVSSSMLPCSPVNMVVLEALNNISVF
nr:hypothetical protein Iba_chr12eCG5620 [Ipomoea batatas]